MNHVCRPACRLTGLFAVFIAGSLASGQETPGGSAATRRPNVLWLIAEDMGPEMACYGTAEVYTPNLDRLAAEGMRFTRAFATAPVCSPSRSAFMTGMYQTTIGAHNHRSHRDDGYRLPEGTRVVTDWLRPAGYFTANVITLPPELKFRGAGKTDWNFSYSGAPFDSDDWNDLKKHRPFFAQINFQEPHRAGKNSPTRFHPAPRRADPAAVRIPPYYPDHPVVREDWANYLDSISSLDEKVGRLMSLLEKEGLSDDTAVIFFGDNGQAHVRGKQWCYDSGLRTPLVIRWPKGIAPPRGFQAGRVNDQLVDLIDLTATTLALAGVSKPAGMEGRVFLGAQAEEPRRYSFGARDRCDETVFRIRTVRDSRWRYVRNYTADKPFLSSNQYKETSYPAWNLLKELSARGELDPIQAVLAADRMSPEELYDVENDPHEIRNLIDSSSSEHQAALARLRKELDRWLNETNDQGATLEKASLSSAAGVMQPDRTHPQTGMNWSRSAGFSRPPLAPRPRPDQANK